VLRAISPENVISQIEGSRHRRSACFESFCDLPGNWLCVTLVFMSEQSEIGANLARVRERIAAAARRAGRDPGEVTLVAITKTHPAHVVMAAYREALRDFGENRVGEASAKIPSIREQVALPDQPRWHMVGHLQRRKARLAVALFDIIHAVDSVRLAERIDRMAVERERVVPVLLEVNVSGEASKYGFDMSASAGPEARAAFIADVEQILALPRLQLRGLMTMAPIVADPEETRPVFAALRRLRDDLVRRFPQAEWRELSMGMTDDFEVAVEEGATMVRIGRAIFGERE
jgi:pyridoxal phosphate enzyme (YggS family)